MVEIPASVALRVLGAVLEKHANNIKQRTSTSAREKVIHGLFTQAGELFGLCDSVKKKTLRIDVFGLLAAIAEGHTEVIGELEDLMLRINPKGEAKLASLRAWDVVGMTKIILGGVPPS